MLGMEEGKTRNQRVRLCEIEYSGDRVLEAFEEKMGGGWKVERKVLRELVEREEELMSKGLVVEAYELFVVRVNMNGIAGELGEGMKLTSVDVGGRTLGEIVGAVVDETSNAG